MENRFWDVELDESNTPSILLAQIGDDFTGLVDEEKGGIIGYINLEHIDLVLNILNNKK